MFDKDLKEKRNVQKKKTSEPLYNSLEETERTDEGMYGWTDGWMMDRRVDRQLVERRVKR